MGVYGPARKDYTGLPEPKTFVGYDLQRTFGKCEIEMMARQVIAFCAETGTWSVRAFQLDRLATLADLIDAEVLNGGHNNHLHRNGLEGLRHHGWLDDEGVTRSFVRRLVEEHPNWDRQSPIGLWCTRGTVQIMNAQAVRRMENGEG
jgi:hypothetical protein